MKTNEESSTKSDKRISPPCVFLPYLPLLHRKPCTDTTLYLCPVLNFQSNSIFFTKFFSQCYTASSNNMANGRTILRLISDATDSLKKNPEVIRGKDFEKYVFSIIILVETETLCWPCQFLIAHDIDDHWIRRKY
jgi:hypothetical protein